jgi:hypothetical protein
VKRLRHIVALVVLLGGASGCTTLAFETAEKKLSQWTDAQCSYAHILVGEPYCVKPEAAKEQAPLYCFRSLGDVDCYAEADPYAINPSGRTLQAPPLATPAPANAAAKPEANAASN